MNKPTFLKTSNATAKDKEHLYEPYITNVRQAFLLGRLAVANENRTWARKKEHSALESVHALSIENDALVQLEIAVRKNATESLQRFYKRSRFAFITEFPNELNIMEKFLPGSTQGITDLSSAIKPKLDVELPDTLEKVLHDSKAYKEAYYLGRIAAAYESRAWAKTMLAEAVNECSRAKNIDSSESLLNTLKSNLHARDAIFVSLKRFYKRNRHLAVEQCPHMTNYMAILLPGSEKGLDQEQTVNASMSEQSTNRNP